ncbi:MAG: exodeoxyribonuclease VII large subunit [Xanthomonadales bacterium]|nr:exodeoxyribonuclease VII large subunit [Xanthomonadales bacterium]
MNAPVRKVLTPSQLNALARSLLEDHFPLVEVEGELSNLSRPASGHLYCTLKDRNAQIRCALFKPRSQWLKFKPADGMQVLARGRLSLYEPRGDYQLILEHMEPAGEGALQRAFEALKAKLQAEGLFDASRKKALPSAIHRLGLITSPRGAAVHDVLSVIGRRFPLLDVELLPVPVQGTEAAREITRMLDRADRSGRYAAILLTRGGGSLEDLACFNDETLARRIAACATPVVSAIGHEIDFTIADFAADLRCPTPSAAAETLTPDGHALRKQLDAGRARLQSMAERHTRTASQSLDALWRRLDSQSPHNALVRHRRRLDDAAARLRAVPDMLRHGRRRALSELAARLQARHPARAMARTGEHVAELRRRLQWLTVRGVQQRAASLKAVAGTLDALSPLRTVARGYSILSNERTVVRSHTQVAPGERVHAQLADGSLVLDVVDTRPAPSD